MTEQSALDQAVDGAIHAVRSVGRIGVGAVGSALGLMRRHRAPPGAAAGIEHAFDLTEAPETGSVRIRCFDYGPDKFGEQEVEDLDAFLAAPKPAWSGVRWINVDGLHAQVVDKFRKSLGFHTLAAEDVMHVPQRPRMEPYPDHLFITARMMGIAAGDRLVSEQISFFVFDGLLITFQEAEGDAFDPIRMRLRTNGSRIRTQGASYLTYALLDAIVDHCFPLLESFGDSLEVIEEAVMNDPRPEVLQHILSMKREFASMRRILWPTRELIDALQRDEAFSEDIAPFLRDVYTHTIQLVDVAENLRESTGSLVELYMSMMSNRMNEVMKVLTIIATLFIPITFIAGVYGMNFKYLPELELPYAYGTFWIVCISIASSLLFFFRRRGWI